MLYSRKLTKHSKPAIMKKIKIIIYIYIYIYMELSNSTIRKQTAQFEKWAKDLNSHFAKENIRMAGVPIVAQW